MDNTIAVYLFGYDLDKIAYPWRESVVSALDFVGPTGAVYFAACDDATFEEAMLTFSNHIDDGRFILSRKEWGDHHTVQAHLANDLLDQIGTKYDWAFKLDADEVLCEWTFEEARKTLDYMSNAGYVLGRPHYLHFSPDDKTTFPFIYNSKAVISRTSTGLRYRDDKGGDACALGGRPEYQTPLGVFHYGKMHMGRRAEALYKEHSFQKLYVDMGFPDPKVEALMPQGYIDYEKVFDVSYAAGEFKPYDGKQPIFVQEWLEKMRQKEEEWKNAH